MSMLETQGEDKFMSEHLFLSSGTFDPLMVQTNTNFT